MSRPCPGNAELLQQLGEADVRSALIDDQPHRPIGRMRAHVDDRPRKALVGHDGHGDQELPFEVAFAPRLALPGVRMSED